MGNVLVGQQAGIAAAATRIEFPYLDGIRGLAALAVVLYHAYLFTGLSGQSAAELPWVGRVVGWGYLGVPVFIVLSGYLLMLPFLKDDSLTYPRGLRTFFARRARRILPPYYAALAGSLALIAAVPLMRTESGTQWDTKVPVTVPDVISHLFLVHDFSSSWVGKINGPLWSVAVEWQIYFVMPLLLIPLWRRLNPLVIIVGISAVTLLISVPFRVIPLAHPWFIALFAMGMLAAQVTMGKRLPRWQFVVAGATLVCVLAATWAGAPSSAGGKGWASEMLVGVVIAVALAFLGCRETTGQPGALRGALRSKPLVLAGTISYSVYLMHSPLLALANLLLIPLGIPLVWHWAAMTFGAVPVAIALCYVLFLLVERRFLNTRQRHARQSLGR